MKKRTRTNRTFEMPEVEIMTIWRGADLIGRKFFEGSREKIMPLCIDDTFKPKGTIFYSDHASIFVSAMIRRGKRRFEFQFLLNAKTKHGRVDVFHSCFDGELPAEVKALLPVSRKPFVATTDFHAARFTVRQ